MTRLTAGLLAAFALLSCSDPATRGVDHGPPNDAAADRSGDGPPAATDGPREAAPTGTIVPADRRVDWHPGVPGGIPNYSTICANVKNAPYGANGDGVADDSAAI